MPNHPDVAQVVGFPCLPPGVTWSVREPVNISWSDLVNILTWCFVQLFFVTSICFKMFASSSAIFSETGIYSYPMNQERYYYILLPVKQELHPTP